MFAEILVTIMSAISAADGVNLDFSSSVEDDPGIISQENVSSAPAGNIASINSDQYEPNDTIKTARSIDPLGYFDLFSYQVSLQATADADFGYPNDDFYYFTALAMSTVTLSISTSNSSCSFTYILFGYDYSITDPDSSYADHDLLIISEDDSTSNIKGYSGFLEAGTYLIYIRGQQELGDYSCIDYNISLQVHVGNGHGSFSVGEMKYRKGLPGAIWVSDFIPGKRLTFLSDSLEYTYYQSNRPYSYPDYALDNIMALTEGEDILAAKIYIWDVELKYCLSHAVNAFKEYVEERFQEQDLIQSSVHIIKDSLTSALKIVGIVSDLAISDLLIGVTLDGLYLSIAEELVNAFFEAIIPKTEIDYGDFVTALEAIQSELTIVDSNGSPINDPQALNDHLETGILTIPIYYKVFDQDTILHQKRLFSYSRTFERIAEAANPHSFLYTPDYSTPISLAQPTGFFRNYGNIYAFDETIVSMDDLTFVSDTSDAQPIVSQIYIPSSNYSLSTAPQLHFGQFYWFEAIAETTGPQYFDISFASVSSPSSLYVELFQSPVDGYSCQGRLGLYTPNYEYTAMPSGATTSIINFQRNMVAGESIYCRVRMNEFQSSPPFSICLGSQSNPINEYQASGLTHLIHENSYNWLNLNQHRATCSACGHSEIQSHAISANSIPHNGYYNCMFCGGLTRFGIIQNGLINVIAMTENGSIKLYDGIMVIVDEDIEALMNGCLVFIDVLNGGEVQ